MKEKSEVGKIFKFFHSMIITQFQRNSTSLKLIMEDNIFILPSMPIYPNMVLSTKPLVLTLYNKIELPRGKQTPPGSYSIS